MPGDARDSFDWARPTTRMRRARDRTWRTAAKVPGIRTVADRPRRQALSASTWKLIGWTTMTDYGAIGKPMELLDIPEDFLEEQSDKIPFAGLREYWYPAFPSKELRNNATKPFRLLGQDVVVFRDADGVARTLDNRCPHRRAMLSLGQVGVYSPGTLTCRYHGWTFDGQGNCVAALTDGPESPIPGRKTSAVRSYPTEDLDGVIWIYMGDEANPQSVYDTIPHARTAMSRPWKYHLYWDWPVNYLQSLDNLADALHPSMSHADCVLYRDMAVWDHLNVQKLTDCGGLEISFPHVGPAHRGKRSFDSWEMHLPGFLYLPMVSPELENHNGMFWAVPIDVGHVRMFDMSSYGGPLVPRIKERIKHQMLAHKYGSPTSIYWCNKGPDQAMAVSQGRVADRRKEHLARSDKGLIAWRKMMSDAWVEEQKRSADRNGSESASLKIAQG